MILWSVDRFRSDNRSSRRQKRWKQLSVASAPDRPSSRVCDERMCIERVCIESVCEKVR